ncbi:MAG: hypothetical protein ABIK09_17570 [Pseudomonadota bacterium]
MRTKLFVLIVVALVGAAFVTSCGEKKADEKKTEKKDEKKVDKKKAEEKAVEPAEKTEEAPAEEAPAEEAPAEEAPAEEAPAEEAPAEEAPAEEAPAEEAPAEEAPETAGACDAYAKCCNAYADALGKVQGVPESAVTATKDGCKQVEQFKTMGAAAEQACKQAMDAMAQAGEAYKAMPGFEFPAECSAEAPAAEAAPAEEAAAPTGEEAPAEEAPAANGDVCDAYVKCCMAYADALGQVQGVPESAVTATKDGCKQIEQLKTMGAAAGQACQQGLDAMKQAGEAYKAMPGFVWPEACN